MATNSIVDYLASQGQDSSYGNRAKLATAQGIQNYQGTAAQNTQLLGVLSQPAPTSVSSASIQPGSQIAIPQNNISQTPQLPIVSPQETAVNNAMTQNSQVEQGYNQVNNDLQTLSKQLENKGTDTLALEQQQGIPQISEKVLELQDLANQKALEANLTPYSLQGQGRGIPTALLRGQEAVKQRQLQVEGIFANAQLASAQGKLALAQSQVDRAINLKYEPILAKIDAQKQILENNKFLLSRSDKKLADAKQVLLDKQKLEQEQKMADEKDINKLIIEASPFAPPSVMAKVEQLKASGASSTQIAQALGEYGKDFLVNQKLRADIAKINADTLKTSNGGGGGVASDNAKSWLAQYNSGALSLEDIYTKIGSSKESLALKNEVSNLVAAQGGKRVYGQDDATIQAINAQIKNVNDLLNGGVGKIVGVVQGGAGIFPDRLNVGKQDALAIAKNLVSNQTLQALADAKSKGVTFGALSERELSTVAEAASRIAAKIKLDEKGNIVGFSGSESQFKKDLEEVRNGLTNSVKSKTGNFVTTGNPQADAYFKSSSSVLQNSNSSSQYSSSGYVDNQK